MTEKKNPVDQISSDLGAVGGLFKKIWQATERAQAGIEAAKEEPQEPRPKRMSRKSSQVIEVQEGCGVCGGTRLVGDKIKIQCPACKDEKRK